MHTTSEVRSVVPNQPKTKTRGIRVPDELWAQALAATERNHENVSDVVRRALVAYVRRNKP